MKETRVKLTLTEEALGTMPSDPEIHDRFIASKAPDAKTRSGKAGVCCGVAETCFVTKRKRMCWR